MSEITYERAFEELQVIVQQMESGDIGVDELSTQVKRAAELMRICKAKLRETEVDVQQILDELAQYDEEPQKP